MYNLHLSRLLRNRMLPALRRDLRMQVVTRIDLQEITVLRIIVVVMAVTIADRAVTRAETIRATEQSAENVDSSSPEIIRVRAADLSETDLRETEITDSREIPVPVLKARENVAAPDRARATVVSTVHPVTEEMEEMVVTAVIIAADRADSETVSPERVDSVVMHL